MNIIFFNSKTLVTRELVNALKKRNDVQLITIQLPLRPPAESAQEIFDKFKKYTPALFLSINDAGYDLEGKLQELVIKSGSLIVNWFHDYPFYEHEFKNKPYQLSEKRIDFISEKSYVDLLKSKGFNSYFLPLATDPAYFNTNEPRTFKRDIAFVGNSSLALMDTIISDEMSEALEKFGKLYLQLKNAYYEDFTISIRDLLLKNKRLWNDKIKIPQEKFIFGMEWMIGFQHRRDFIIDISNTYKDNFVVFGDLYWKQFVNNSKVTPEACYYDNLCHYYRTTKINLNVNRVQIRTSFTQRHFDCKASGAFLLTDKRECNGQFFITEGPDKEIAEYESLPHCHELIKYYLEQEDERERIAEAGIERILNNHTYDNRIEEIKNVCKKKWGI